MSPTKTCDRQWLAWRARSDAVIVFKTGAGGHLDLMIAQHLSDRALLQNPLPEQKKESLHVSRKNSIGIRPFAI